MKIEKPSFSLHSLDPIASSSKSFIGACSKYQKGQIKAVSLFRVMAILFLEILMNEEISKNQKACSKIKYKGQGTFPKFKKKNYKNIKLQCNVNY